MPCRSLLLILMLIFISVQIFITLSLLMLTVLIFQQASHRQPKQIQICVLCVYERMLIMLLSIYHTAYFISNVIINVECLLMLSIMLFCCCCLGCCSLTLALLSHSCLFNKFKFCSHFPSSIFSLFVVCCSHCSA